MTSESDRNDGELGSNDGELGSVTMRRVELSAAPIGRMINIISLIAGLISVTVIGGVIVLAFRDIPIPSELSNWGGIILGFYFGQFISIVKDYMGVIEHGGKK